MTVRNLTATMFVLLVRFHTLAQAIDNNVSYKNINTNSYLRFNYENDFFSGTDKYYTQGLHLELTAPWLSRLPLSRLLAHPHYYNIRYGIGAEHDGYTPSSISNPVILYGDRPFAACLFLKTFLIATDSINRQRFSSSVSTGIIGQAAGGMEMQTGIHRWLHDITPHGWPNQVHNDAILNYQAEYEKQLLKFGQFLSVDGAIMARAGTLSDKAGTGITLMAGWFDDPFSGKTGSKRSFRIYAYEHPGIDAIAFDASLQGGMLNHTSPYTIPSANISRITFNNRFGFVVAWQRIYLEYFQSLLSPEFKTGNYHVWGGIQIAAGL